jgi:putative hydrolase of the HAD superfamily
MNYKAIFFDQDNTLVNSSEVGKVSYFKALSVFADNHNLSEEDVKDKWKEVLSGVLESKDPQYRYFDYSLKQVMLSYEEFSQAEHDDLMKIYYDALQEKIRLNPTVSEYFSNKIDVLHILFTEDSKRQSEIKLNKFDLKEKFDYIITSETAGVMKPNIKYFDLGWDKFDLNPNECVYIGDKWEKDCKLGVEKGGVGLLYDKELDISKGIDLESDPNRISDFMTLKDLIKPK